MAKQKFRITNWRTYNKALINRGPSLSGWMMKRSGHGMSQHLIHHEEDLGTILSDLAITTVLVIKRAFRFTLRTAQGFVDSIFTVMGVPLHSPDYSSVRNRA